MERLDALTALRFFAACAVVWFHAGPKFAIVDQATMERSALSETVCFFFILSGFILSHVYGEIRSIDAVKTFIRARIARIYPAHVAALALAGLLLRLSWAPDAPVAQIIAANLLLIHGWIPQIQYYFSVNSPSWSVSTEFFFYLSFPLLVYKIDKTWLPKLFALFGLVCAGIIGSAALHLSELGSTITDVTMLGVVYINPLARIFEFMIGICCGLLWKRLKHRSPSRSVMSVVEVVTMTLMLAYLCSIGPLTESMRSQGAYMQALHMWLLHSGNCIFIAAFILTCAFQRGFISRFMSLKPFVYLGELSYSMYLIHATFLIFYERNSAALANVHPFACLGVFAALLLIGSHLTFEYIEKPMRDWINGTKRRKSAAQPFVNRTTIIVILEIVILLGAGFYIKEKIKLHNRAHSRAQREQEQLLNTKTTTPAHLGL